MKEETRYLWISQLPPNATHQSLTDLFSSYGRVLNTKIHEAGNLRGAVLSFLDTKTAAKACSASHLLNGQSLTSEYCDQSGEPGLQKLKDSANGKYAESKKSDHSSSENYIHSSPNRPKSHHRQDSNRGWYRALKLWNFPDRSSESSIQNGLYHEFKKIGKVCSVQVKNERDARHAVIYFKRSEDAEQAYEIIRNGKSFFGMTLNVERVETSLMADDSEAAIGGSDSANNTDEYNSRASRMLQVSGIDRSLTEADLRQMFGRYGTVLDVDIKSYGGNQSSSASMYANVQFADIRSVVNALRRPDAVQVRGQRLKLSFGRSPPTKCIWLANLADSVSDSFLTKNFASHGTVHEVCINFQKHRALVFYKEMEDAQRALSEMKNRCIAGKKLQIDYASQLCQKHFLNDMVNSGQYPSKCRSNYKIFEKLFPPELHRGLIPNRKAAARYRKMMLEYMKANHRSLGKYRDHHYDSDREHSRRHDELSPYSDHSHHDEHRSHSKSSRRGVASPSASQRSRNRDIYSKSRSPQQQHQHRQSADSSTSSSPIRSAVCQADLRSLIERSKSSNRSCTQRSLTDSNRRRGSSSESVASSDGEAAKAAKDKSLKKLEQEKQMLLAQLANLDDMHSETNSSAANSDAENSRVAKASDKKQQQRSSSKGGSAESSFSHSDRLRAQEPSSERQHHDISKSISDCGSDHHQHSNIPQNKGSQQGAHQLKSHSSAEATSTGTNATYDLDAKIKQIRRESSSDLSQQQHERVQQRSRSDQHNRSIPNGPSVVLDPRLQSTAAERNHSEQHQTVKMESCMPSEKQHTQHPQEQQTPPPPPPLPPPTSVAKKSHLQRPSAAEMAELDQDRELEERIKAIDAKLMPQHHHQQQQQQQLLNSPSARGSCNSISSSSSTAAAPTQAPAPLVDYSKYRIRKRNEAMAVPTTASISSTSTQATSGQSVSQTVPCTLAISATSTADSSETAQLASTAVSSVPQVSIPDTSDFVKSMLFQKSSVFEQDAKRLEQTTASYDVKQHSRSIGSASAGATTKTSNFFNYPAASSFSNTSLMSPVPQLQLTSSPVSCSVLSSPPPSANPGRSILKSPTTPVSAVPLRSPTTTSMRSPTSSGSTASLQSPVTPINSTAMKFPTPSAAVCGTAGVRHHVSPPTISIPASTTVKSATSPKTMSPAASLTPKSSSASFILNQNVAKRKHPDAPATSDSKKQKILSRQSSQQQEHRNSAMETLFKPDNQYNQLMKKKTLSDKTKSASKLAAASATPKSKTKVETGDESMRKKLSIDTGSIQVTKTSKLEKEAKKVKQQQQQSQESPVLITAKRSRESDLFCNTTQGDVKREKLSRSEELFDKIKAEKPTCTKDSIDKEVKEKRSKEIKAAKAEAKEHRKKRKASASDQLMRHSKSKQSVDSLFGGSISKHKLAKSMSVETPEVASALHDSEKAKLKADRRKSSLISSSDEDEWKPSCVANRSTGSTSWELEYLGFQPYESMYDKIKRRQAKRIIEPGTEPRSSKMKDRRADDQLKVKRHRIKSDIKSISSSGTDADNDDVLFNQQEQDHHQFLHREGNKSFVASTSSFKHDTSDSSDTEASNTHQSHSPRTPTGTSALFGKKSKLADSCNEADDEGELESRKKSARKLRDKEAQSNRRKSTVVSSSNKSKISVDSVFGQLSDSGASDDTDMQYLPTPEDVKTPTTVEMTDESQAESISEAGSPGALSVQTKATRLTDIFAEVKAQLDPRSVTEKSLFNFPDDDGFEPAPDLPTIDRIQPEENASESSPDRRDDEEPPNLSADSGDSSSSACAAAMGSATPVTNDKSITSSAKQLAHLPHHELVQTQQHRQIKSPPRTPLHSPTLKPAVQVANLPNKVPARQPVAQPQQQVKLSPKTKSPPVRPQQSVSSAATQQPALNLRPLIPASPPSKPSATTASIVVCTVAAVTTSSAPLTATAVLSKENLAASESGSCSIQQQQQSTKDQQRALAQPQHKIIQDKQLPVQQRPATINITNKIAQPPVALPDALLKQHQQPLLVKSPLASSPTANVQQQHAQNADFDNLVQDAMLKASRQEPQKLHTSQQQAVALVAGNASNWERKLETTFNEVLTKTEEQKPLAMPVSKASIAAIPDSKPVTATVPCATASTSTVTASTPALNTAASAPDVLQKQQPKPTTISLTANLHASKHQQVLQVHQQNDSQLQHSQNSQLQQYLYVQKNQPQQQQENQINQNQSVPSQQTQQQLQQQQHQLQQQQHLTPCQAQQKPAKRQPQPMDSIALQHIDEIIQDVTEGKVDLEQYMDRDMYRKRYQSGDSSCTSLSTLATPASCSSTTTTAATVGGVRTPATTPKPSEVVMQQQMLQHQHHQQQKLQIQLQQHQQQLQQQQIQHQSHQQLHQQQQSATLHQQQQHKQQPLLPSLTPKPVEQLLPVSSATAVTSASGSVPVNSEITLQQLPVSTAAALQQQGQPLGVEHQAAVSAAAAAGVAPFPPFTAADSDPNSAAAVMQMHQWAQYIQLMHYPQELLYQYPYLSLYQSQQQMQQAAAPGSNTVSNSSVSAASASKANSSSSNNTNSSTSSSAGSGGQLNALLRKYPVKWQGRMALKNDEAGVQMHFVFGSEQLVKPAMDLATPDETVRVLRIVQRMRLEAAQLEGVQRKMSDESEFCMLLAVACGVDSPDYHQQTQSLRESFIKYLQEKQAAGIVNVNEPTAGGHEQPAFVIHIFPPGQFATEKLKCYAGDLFANLFPQPNSETPHLLVVITTV